MFTTAPDGEFLEIKNSFPFSPWWMSNVFSMYRTHLLGSQKKLNKIFDNFRKCFYIYFFLAQTGVCPIYGCILYLERYGSLSHICLWHHKNGTPHSLRSYVFAKCSIFFTLFTLNWYHIFWKYFLLCKYWIFSEFSQ